MPLVPFAFVHLELHCNILCLKFVPLMFHSVGEGTAPITPTLEQLASPVTAAFLVGGMPRYQPEPDVLPASQPNVLRL